MCEETLEILRCPHRHHVNSIFDQDISDWPQCGGANGSIRFKPEIDHGANAGLVGALKLLDPIKEKFPEVSYADLFQMASALAIEVGTDVVSFSMAFFAS